MRRTASEIIRNLESRIAKLEKQATQSGSISIRHKELPYESPRGVLKRYTDDYDKVTAYYGFGPHWDERYTFKGLSEREEKRLLKDVRSLPQVDEVAMFVEDDSEKGYRNIKASENRIARLERQAGSKQAGRIGKKCVITEIYREGREGGEGEAVIVCDGVRIGVNFDTLGHSFIVGNDRHLRETGATAIFESLKKEYRKTDIKEYIATAVGIAGEEGMTLDQCVKLSEMMF